MLVFGLQIYDTAKMNVDREAQDQGKDRQPQGDGGAVEISVALSLPFEPIPPPPSAPSEFLTFQWMRSSSLPGAHRKAGEPLAPPPPSAPGEFLSAQWLDGVIPEFPPVETDVAKFKEAVSESIESSDQLDILACAPKFSEESFAFADGTLPDQGDEAAPVRIREVALAPDEEIGLVFLPDEGLVNSVPSSGQALILTSHRLIAFRGVEGFRDTHMAIASEISQCSVRTGQRNWGAILQGLMIMVGGAFLYLIVGYWLAGQVSGPNVPVLNIDVAPLIALLIILAGLFVLASNYFTRPAGALIFHGEGVEIAFPFRSSLGLDQVYDFVDRAQSARWRRNANGQGTMG